EGTFPLPEAQLDRFLMHVRVGYPEAEAEAAILRLARDRAIAMLEAPSVPADRISQADVLAARSTVLALHMAPAVERYLIEIVLASRDAARYDQALAQRIAWGPVPAARSRWSAVRAPTPGLRGVTS